MCPISTRPPNAKEKGATRGMNTVKFWLEPALHKYLDILKKCYYNKTTIIKDIFKWFVICVSFECWIRLLVADPSKNFWSKRLKKGWNLRPKSGSNDSFLGPTLSPGSKLGRAKWPRLSRFLVLTLSPGQNFSLLVST